MHAVSFVIFFSSTFSVYNKWFTQHQNTHIKIHRARQQVFLPSFVFLVFFFCSFFHYKVLWSLSSFLFFSSYFFLSSVFVLIFYFITVLLSLLLLIFLTHFWLFLLLSYLFLLLTRMTTFCSFIFQYLWSYFHSIKQRHSFGKLR